MAFTGKATYTAGVVLPEIAEDVADLVGIISPFETPLLDHLGDPLRAAHSIMHEWLEDSLLPNTDTINFTFSHATSDATFGVAHVDRFRAGDQIAPAGSNERLLVTAVNAAGGQITVVRGYGGTAAAALADGQELTILGNAALEGDDADAARFTVRTRQSNYTQIFSKTITVSGSELAVKQIALADELDYQKQERLRELLRDLESTVINGVAPATDAGGTAATRRTMGGLLGFVQTHRLAPGDGTLPAGTLTEEMLNIALRTIWDNSAGKVDTILVGGSQKRRINGFITTQQRYATSQTTTYRDMVGVYESDFGVCRVVLSRYVPSDKVLLLDSSRLAVLPLAGRSFHYRPLASTGDFETGQVIGEYTLELRNEAAHGVIGGLS
jgi:hypothetical protein